MPIKAPTPCRHPGCPATVSEPGYCEQHKGGSHRDYGRARRGFDTEVTFYQSTRWRALRATVLREQPLCRLCHEQGVLQAAKVVDHITPIKQGGARFDRSNLQSLCVSCHNAKTAKERTSG